MPTLSYVLSYPMFILSYLFYVCIVLMFGTALELRAKFWTSKTECIIPSSCFSTDRFNCCSSNFFLCLMVSVVCTLFPKVIFFTFIHTWRLFCKRLSLISPSFCAGIEVLPV